LPAASRRHRRQSIGSVPSQAQPDPYEFDVMVTDANGLTDTASLAVTVVVKPLLILTSNPIPQAAKDFAYVLPISLASTGGGAPFSWTQAPVGAGETNLAAIGMQVTPDGRLTDLGTGPTTLGTHKFTLQVTDEATQVATRQFQLTVNPGPVLTDINPRLASLPSLYTVTGLNFQPGAKLVLKPGPSEAIFTPTFVSPTTLTFSAPFPTPIGATGPVAVKVLNPDGGFHTKPSALVFPANTLGFATKGFIGSTLSSTGLDAADVNGDGFADIIHSGSGAITAVYNTTTSTTGGLILHMNLGTTSPTFSTLVLDSGNYTDVKFVDVNVDGKLDIVALGHTTIRSWIGLGNGTFTVGPTSTLNGPGSPLWPSEMTFGRFNADAVPDVAFGTPNFNYLGYQNINGRVYSMAGTGTGAFTPLDAATTTISGTYGVVSLQAIDTDNDGHSELAAGCGLSVSAGPAFNFTTLSASGFFSGWTSRGGALNPPLYSSTTGTAVGDFLGNGTKQLAAVTSGSPNYSNYQVFRIYSGNDLSAITTLPVPNAAGKSLAAIDGDFDTKSDILMTSSQSTILVTRLDPDHRGDARRGVGHARALVAEDRARRRGRHQRRRHGGHPGDDLVLARQRDGFEPRHDVHHEQHRQRRLDGHRLLPEHVELTAPAGSPATGEASASPSPSRPWLLHSVRRPSDPLIESSTASAKGAWFPPSRAGRRAARFVSDTARPPTSYGIAWVRARHDPRTGDRPAGVGRGTPGGPTPMQGPRRGGVTPRSSPRPALGRASRS
jgi:hypothetical protein